MKGGQNLRDLQAKAKESEPWVKPQPCVMCGKVIAGAYGHHGDNGWTCSALCERNYDASVSRGNPQQAQAG